MNALLVILKVMHEHMTADSDDIYVEALRLVQHCIDELETHDYETNSDGELIISTLNEAVEEYEASLREDEEEEEDEDEDKERVLEDIDEDVPDENKGTVFNQTTPIEESTTGT